MVRAEHKQTHVIVSLIGPVTQQSVIELVDAINQLRTDFFYRRVDLRIASPGGEVLALDYFIEYLDHWKRQDLIVTTRALTSCSSAAAIMLSLGDDREASASSVLLYHDSRMAMGQDGPITSEDAEAISEKLKEVDDRMRARLVDRVVDREAQARSVHSDGLVDTDKSALKSIRLAVSSRSGDQPGGESDEEWLDSWMCATYSTTQLALRRERWSMLYDALFDEDKPISAMLAIRLGLVDRLVGPTADPIHQQTPEGSTHWLEIPEWRSAFPGGRIDERILRRHTLILGETGSGKTRSAILPVLLAAYHSPRVGVGLIIDPKRELDAVLRKRALADGDRPGKRLVWIRTDENAINLMGNGRWSIGEMVEEGRYWSAAERVLQRVATVTSLNPAGVLLGQPPPDDDPYWPREGAALATTVLAIAIDFLTRPQRYVADAYEETRGKDPMWPVALKRLEMVGRRLGLYEHPVRSALDTAERLSSRGIEPRDEFDLVRMEAEEGGTGLEEAGIGEGELERRRAYRRECAVDELMREFKRVNLPSDDTRALDESHEEWQSSDRSRSDLDTLIREIDPIARVVTDKRIPNVLTVASKIFDELFGMVEGEKVALASDGSFRPFVPNSDDIGYTPLHALADGFERSANGEFDLVARSMRKFADMRETGGRQYAGVFGSASTIWSQFITPEIQDTIYFGCEMPDRWVSDRNSVRSLEFEQDVGRSMDDLEETCGTFYVFQPDPYGLDNLVAKACKVLFFESVIGNEERARRGEEMPLAAYIADEFQRFITADRVHGEQSFLDVCRSFGAFTVVACQSIASLHYALCSVESDEQKRRSAIDIICNNTATKLFFRTTDKDTSERVDNICPAMSGGQLVTRVRPLSTLAPGECYASFPDGRFERIQLDPFA